MLPDRKQKVTLAELPAPSTNIVTEPELVAARGSLTIRLRYERDDLIFSSGFRFHRVRAYQHRAESLCTAWHIEDAYDTLVEVRDSGWVADLRSAQPAGSAGSFAMRHFMIYLDSSGSFEVVAADWQLLPEVADPGS